MYNTTHGQTVAVSGHDHMYTITIKVTLRGLFFAGTKVLYFCRFAPKCKINTCKNLTTPHELGSLATIEIAKFDTSKMNRILNQQKIYLQIANCHLKVNVELTVFHTDILAGGGGGGELRINALKVSVFSFGFLWSYDTSLGFATS